MARGQSSIARRRYSVHLSDLEKTVLFALQNEVAVKEEINMAALTEFLDVLLLYFPPASRLQPVLTELRRDMNSSSSEASRQILAIDVGPPVEWVGCRGSAPQFGGFPCGLWQLWHTLTIGHRQATMGRTVEEPRVVLRAMVTYVREFFTCRCSLTAIVSYPGIASITSSTWSTTARPWRRRWPPPPRPCCSSGRPTMP